MRSQKGLFTRYQLHNKKLFVAYCLSLASILSIVYIPFLQPFFGSAPLNISDWVTVLGIVIIFTFIRQLGYWRKPKTS